MTPKPTIAALLHDETLLRQIAGRALNPGPWEHHWYGYGTQSDGQPVWMHRCLRCEGESALESPPRNGCPVPDPATGPLEVIREQLLRKLTRVQLIDTITVVYPCHAVSADSEMCERVALESFVWAAIAEQIACCLIALGEAVI